MHNGVIRGGCLLQDFKGGVTNAPGSKTNQIYISFFFLIALYILNIVDVCTSRLEIIWCVLGENIRE